MAGQQTPGTLPSHPSTQNFSYRCHARHTWLLRGIELRSPCLLGRHFTNRVTISPVLSCRVMRVSGGLGSWALYLADGTSLQLRLLASACSCRELLPPPPLTLLSPCRPCRTSAKPDLLALQLKPWEVQPEEPACRALCFITIYCSCYFNIYGVRLSCELASQASLWSDSLQGAGLSVPALILALSTLLKTTVCLGLPLFPELLCIWPQVHPKPLDTAL